MKKSILLFAIIFSFLSCSKSDTPSQTPVNNYAPFGYFTGSAVSLADNSTTPMVFVFEDGGKLTIGIGATLNNALGVNPATYAISGNTISGTIAATPSSPARSYTGTYDPNTGKLTGTMGAGTAKTGYATFTMQKQIPSGTGESLVKGYYTGKYTLYGTQYPEVMVLEAGGVMRLIAKPNFTDYFTISPLSTSGNGSYKIIGNTITGNYTYSSTTYSFMATYDPTTKKLTGTEGIAPATTGTDPFIYDMRN